MHKTATATALTLSLVCLTAFAVPPPPPDAGQILKTLPPAIPAPPATTGTGALPEAQPERPPLKVDDRTPIRVQRIVFSGNTAFSQDVLLPLVQDALGQSLTLEGLNALANRITQYYRDQGYLLARAYIPAQDITAGTLEIAVLEGRYGKVRLDNHSRVSDTVLLRMLSRLESDQLIAASLLERQLLLMSDLPGVVISSTLKPGTTTGTSDLTVRADDGPALSGSAGMDNWGNRYTGAVRTFVAADWANPLGLGDRLSLYGMGATSGGTQFGRAAYDLPINGAGTRLGAAYAHLAYSLGLDFAALQAHGTADITSLYLSHPLTRSRAANTTLLFNVDHRTLRDHVDSTSGSDVKDIDVASMALSGDRTSLQGAMGTWNAALTGGHLKLDPLTAAADEAAYRTAGDYFKLTGGATQLQPVAGRWSVYGAFSGQLASKNLDMSEKFAAGGPMGVRAYPVGEAMADDALLGTLELRYALTEQWQLAGFADAGVARLNHSALATDTDNQRNLSGLGVGATWKHRSNISFLTYLAWRTGDAPTSAPDYHPTVWAQLTKVF